jgi:hypothetical protein
MKKTKKFKLGQKVYWFSSGNGWYVEREGVIVKIMAPGERPEKEEFPDFYKGWNRPGKGRKQESYVVRVDSKRSCRHFWPLVSQLRDKKPKPHEKPLGREAMLKFL